MNELGPDPQAPSDVAVHGYRVVILSADRPDLVDELAVEIGDLASNIKGTRASVDITTGPTALFADPNPDDPTTALVIIGGPLSAADASIAAAAESCRKAMRVCVPIFDPASDFASQLPLQVHELNGVPWPAGTPARSAASLVLRLLGLAESERRAFISYRRSDASPLANQLRYSLIDAGWEVFLDRFSVPPASVFQEQLDRDLADKAFVVLLESPDAITSQWVEHEVAFAHMHRFGLMSLALPETQPSEYFPAVLDDLRVRLVETDVQGPAGGRVLTEGALERILNAIDLRHARAFQQRREVLMLDAAGELERSGYDIQTIGSWALLASGGAREEVIHTTPRAPEPRDLMTVETLRQQVRVPGRRTRGWVVHPLEDIDRDRASLIGWLSRRRQVGPTPVMLLRSRVAR